MVENMGKEGPLLLYHDMFVTRLACACLHVCTCVLRPHCDFFVTAALLFLLLACASAWNRANCHVFAGRMGRWVQSSSRVRSSPCPLDRLVESVLVFSPCLRHLVLLHECSASAVTPSTCATLSALCLSNADTTTSRKSVPRTRLCEY